MCRWTAGVRPGQAGQFVPLRVGHRRQVPGLGMEPRQQQMPGVEDQVLVKPPQVMALVVQVLDEAEEVRAVAVDDGRQGP